MNLHQALTALPGVGPKSAEKFKKLGLESLQDLLLYFPFRYEDFKSKNVLDLEDGEKAVISGIVATPANVQYYGYKRNRLRFTIKQGEVVIVVNFFNQPYLADKIELGATVAIFGKWDKAKASLTGMKVLAQVEDDLQPVYRVAQGISQASLVKLIKVAFDQGLDQLLEENLPPILLERYQLLGRTQAVRAMHFPKDLTEYKQALRRVKFEELFYFQMQLQVLKHETKDVSQGLAIPWQEKMLAQKKAALPFSLTEAQERSLEEILSDLQSPAHMNRLLQGDVGSGKTVVAGLAMYAAYTAGYQSALMVPTEILAEQHLDSLTQLFPELNLALLTGGMRAAERRETLAAIESGQVDMVVGTHALIQEGVVYHRLGLVIIDEQHRFGVVQRARLWEKSLDLLPHVLIMSATPIPRTLAMTLYGDLDISVIDELPPGRKPITTRHYFDDFSEEVFRLVERELFAGRQIYVVYPMIEGTEDSDYKNLETGYEQYRYRFGDRNVTWVHGKLKPQEKQQRMEQFVSGEIPILLSTTVIEVGVNVPNASVMVIENADRFGLAQLHQLRGRVGRGAEQSYCLLLSKRTITPIAVKRIEAMCSSNDGFFIAEEDLKLRGAGDIEGTRQSGDLSGLRIAEPSKDLNILYAAAQTVREILEQDASLEGADMATLAEELERIYPKSKSWGAIG